MTTILHPHAVAQAGENQKHYGFSIHPVRAIVGDLRV
jgi:hypothetical protein